MVSEVVSKEGYKETELGRIPEEWKIKRLEEIAKIKMGQSPSSEFYNLTGKGLPLIQGNADVKKRKTIKRVYTTLAPKTCLPNDIIMTVRAPVGEVSIARYKSCIGRGVCSIQSQNKFLYHYLIYRENDWKTLSTGSTFESINSRMVRDLIVVRPTKKEQIAIASVLSDMDGLIESLEKVIDKKQKIKQGTIQNLLTGKKRLPGFEGNWENSLVRDISKITTGNKDTQDRIVGGVYPFYVRSSTIERINTYSFDGEAVLTAGDGVGTGKVFHYVNGKFDLHQRVYKISDFKDKVYGYYFYILFSNYFLERISMMSAKSSVDSVRMEMIADMEIMLPSYKEQQAIATILSDMDTEIELLEKKLEKYEQMKEGMMQQLLTGRIRIV